ncbi:putative Late nodulin [Medicago truncatula]|nr:putative Late nodulin [Medicago truncatula]
MIIFLIFIIVTNGASNPCVSTRDCTTHTCNPPLVARCINLRCYCGYK